MDRVTCVVLANSDYKNHTTDEGEQLQQGLRTAGWILSGRHYDNLVDVRAILDRYQPDIVFAQDVRDWDPASSVAFNKRIGFERVEALRDWHGLVATVVKDAGTFIDYQCDFAAKIRADAIVHYYHQKSILEPSPWLKSYRLVRTYHTVDKQLCDHIPIDEPRKKAILTGARSAIYPLRYKARRNCEHLGLDVQPHPGYGNRGCHTPKYLETLAGYRVHLATASRFKFALRKIIESVAMGTTPITDLPAYDVLPGIDAALIRVSPDIELDELRTIIDQAADQWDEEKAYFYAHLARTIYDWRRMGHLLDEGLKWIQESRDMGIN